jgi:SAM-dependent methyltransferase
MTEAFPDEPLAESALLAHQLARAHCAPDPATGEPCAWYHGFWLYMRLMGLAKTSGGHADFLAGELRSAARHGDCSRILISGAVDFSMAACVLNAYRQEGAQPDLAMVDRCATPLALTRWYGKRHGVSIATFHSDILAFEGAQRCDVIVTNSFLGYFDPPARLRLFARWAGLLRPGGRLIITNRIRPGDGHEPVGFTEAQARAFTETVRSEAQRLKLMSGIEPDDLARMARVYAGRFRSVPLRSAAEVVELLSGGGFRIERLDTAPAAGRVEGVPLAGPTLAEATDYVRIAATRL